MGCHDAARASRTGAAVRRAFLWVLPLILATGMPSSAGGPEQPVALLDGRSIPLSEVSRFHCHDRDAPTIRCFSTSAERDRDLDTGAAGLMDADQPFVTVYRDEDYHGNSLVIYDPIRNLGVYGWNDRITSFKSLNGQRPRLYSHVDYGTPAWRWTAGAWVPNVGSEANDATSSIRNEP